MGTADLFLDGGKLLDSVGLTIAEYDDPKTGTWLSCPICNSDVICLRQQVKGETRTNNPRLDKLFCENGCNKDKLAHLSDEIRRILT